MSDFLANKRGEGRGSFTKISGEEAGKVITSASYDEIPPFDERQAKLLGFAQGVTVSITPEDTGWHIIASLLVHIVAHVMPRNGLAHRGCSHWTDCRKISHRNQWVCGKYPRSLPSNRICDTSSKQTLRSKTALAIVQVETKPNIAFH